MPDYTFHSRGACRFLLGFALLVCLFGGCSQQSTEISGRVTLDGKPFKLGENVRGTVIFQSANRQGPTLNGLIDNAGRFQLSAGSSISVNPGVYLVTVSDVEIQQPLEVNGQPTGKRITPEKYAVSSSSGLRIVVNPGENDVLLELVGQRHFRRC